VNRWIFRTGSAAQLLLGAVLLAAVWPLGAALRAVALVLFVLTAAQALGLAGVIASFGRDLDFVPRPLPPPLGRRFGLLHGAYVIGDLAKGVLLAVTVVLLSRRPPA
jgi:uncharacterized membrane protein